jgi:hypothetical protein
MMGVYRSGNGALNFYEVNAIVDKLDTVETLAKLLDLKACA